MMLGDASFLQVLLKNARTQWLNPPAYAAHHDGYSQSLEFTLSICLCYTLCILGLRLYIRWSAFSLDDLFVLLSTGVACVFFGCSYALKGAGLAASMKTLIAMQDSMDKVNTLILVNNVSWITALCLSKLAIVLMLLRTTLATAHRRLQYLVGAFIVVQCIVTITLMTAGCSKFEGLFWDIRINNTSCARQELRWRVITGLDIATELAILVLPLHLVWKLQMAVKNKIVVVAAFWLRIFNIVFTIFRNGATNDLNSTADVSLTAGMVMIWQTLEMAYSIAAATIAALKRFTESLNTGFGHGELIRVHGNTQSYKLSDQSTSPKGSRASEPCSSVATNHSHRDEHHKPGGKARSRQLKLRPDENYNEATISSPRSQSGRETDLDRGAHAKENIIRHDLQYSVHYDEEPLVLRHT